MPVGVDEQEKWKELMYVDEFADAKRFPQLERLFRMPDILESLGRDATFTSNQQMFWLSIPNSKFPP